MRKASIWLVLSLGIIGMSLSGCACLGWKCGEETAASAAVQAAPERTPAPVQVAPPLKKDRY